MQLLLKAVSSKYCYRAEQTADIVMAKTVKSISWARVLHPVIKQGSVDAEVKSEQYPMRQGECRGSADASGYCLTLRAGRMYI